MLFTWDEEKNRENKIKHHVSFEVARHVFSDPRHLSIQDRHKNGEERWQTIGLVAGVLLILVARAWGIEDKAEIRIISARKADARERKRYENGIE